MSTLVLSVWTEANISLQDPGFFVFGILSMQHINLLFNFPFIPRIVWGVSSLLVTCCSSVPAPAAADGPFSNNY